jgi:DNA-binding NarL/FixJ family response regulator
VRNGPIRVFVVEDEWLYREAVVSTLSSSLDFEIGGQSEKGETALARMLADPPQIALVDVDLPDTRKVGTRARRSQSRTGAASLPASARLRLDELPASALGATEPPDCAVTQAVEGRQ